MAYVDSKGIRFNSFDSNVLARIKKVGNDYYDHVTIYWHKNQLEESISR